MRRWLWVTLRETYTNHSFREGDRFAWTCDPENRSGDVAILYRAELFQDFAYVFRTTTDAYHHPAIAAEYGAPACDCTLIIALQAPILLREVRTDTVLARWPAAVSDFHGTAFSIDPVYWRALVAISSPVDRPRLRAAGGC
jgi:hypothetical protein